MGSRPPARVSTEIHLNPIAAYDRIASQFENLSEAKRPYLSTIEQIIVSTLAGHNGSLLDIGAGDGTRALRISRAAGIQLLVLLEPSPAMRQKWPASVTGWNIPAQQLSEKDGRFDAITCLWNVLGHIFPQSARVAVLGHCARLLAPEGQLFVDVNNRYNVRHYGLLRTSLRIAGDLLRPSKNNGDVTVRWNVGNTTYLTEGHVFTHREFLRMAQAAGLTVEKSITVNYSTGLLHSSRFAGNPLYLLRRSTP